MTEEPWHGVLARWSRAEELIHAGGQFGTTRMRRALLPNPWKPVVPIVVTGTASAGKTALLRVMAGRPITPRADMSTRPEREWIVLKTPRHRVRATVVVLPGQKKGDSPTKPLARIFGSDGVTYPTGVIHVVSGGFDKPWNTSTRLYMIERSDRKIPACGGS